MMRNIVKNILRESDWGWAKEIPNTFEFEYPWALINDLGEFGSMQEFLFLNGYTWHSGDTNVKYEDGNYAALSNTAYNKKVFGYWDIPNMSDLDDIRDDILLEEPNTNIYYWSDIKKSTNINESDDFEWIRDVNMEFTMDSILFKQIYYRPSNHNDLVEEYGKDYNPELLELGDIRYYDGWVIVDYNEDKATLRMDRFASTLDWDTDDVLKNVNTGIWVVMSDDGKPLNESNDFDWIGDTEIGLTIYDLEGFYFTYIYHDEHQKRNFHITGVKDGGDPRVVYIFDGWGSDDDFSILEDDFVGLVNDGTYPLYTKEGARVPNHMLKMSS